jgi:hypothetical protein
VLATFNFAQAQPANRRTIHILGSEARLYGVVDDDYFTIYHRTGPNDEKAEKVRIDANTEYGHNGGDPILTSDFWNLIHGIEHPWRPGLKEGIESAVMCLVAEESVKTGSSIELTPTRKQVFETGAVPAAKSHRTVPTR